MSKPLKDALSSEYGEQRAEQISRSAWQIYWGATHRWGWFREREDEILLIEGGHEGIVDQIIGEIVLRLEEGATQQEAEAQARNDVNRRIQSQYGPVGKRGKTRVLPFRNSEIETEQLIRPAIRNEIGPRNAIVAAFEMSSPQQRAILKAVEEGGTRRAARKKLKLSRQNVATQMARLRRKLLGRGIVP